MNREAELINYLKQPVFSSLSSRWKGQIPAHHRFIHKSYGGKNKGRWSLFKDCELSPHKAFSDSLVATLVAKGLMIKFCQENDRAFFLRETVKMYLEKNALYCYDEYVKTMAAYKRL